MDGKNNSRANLKKYIKVQGKWRFVPVLKQGGVPYPDTAVIDGEPVRSTNGTFYLEYYEDGRRVQRPVGTAPPRQRLTPSGPIETTPFKKRAQPCLVGRGGPDRVLTF